MDPNCCLKHFSVKRIFSEIFKDFFLEYPVYYINLFSQQIRANIPIMLSESSHIRRIIEQQQLFNNVLMCIRMYHVDECQ